MLTLYQKYHTYLNLLLVLLLGLVSGLLVTSFLATYINPLPARGNITAQATEKAVQKTTLTDLNMILQRNIFDPDSRSDSATLTLITPTNTTSTQTAAQNNETQPAPKNMTLLGTVAAGDDSLALIEIDRELDLYHLGDELIGGGVIEEISRNKVIIRNRDKSLTTLVLSQDAPTPKTINTSRNSNTPDSDIKQIADDHWVVPRDTAEKTRSNLAVEMRLAQLQPRITDGQTDGFMIRRLRRNSILNKLGLKRGDVIMQVNNMTLDSPETALQIFQQLREARQISVGIERKGATQTFTYELD